MASIAFALAACAMAALFGGDALWNGNAAAEESSTVLWILGVVALLWAVIVGGVALGFLIRRLVRGERTALLPLAITIATAALIAVTTLTHPFIGTGSAVA